MEPLTIIDDPAAWTAKDYPNLEQARNRTLLTLLHQPPPAIQTIADHTLRLLLHAITWL